MEPNPEIQSSNAKEFHTFKIVECPRDAMQGLKDFIPTEKKIDYLNALLKVGFDTLDFGSFVSPKAIPQLRDTAEVLSGLELNPQTKLLAIVANEKGAEMASKYSEIKYLGFPFSISEEFQKRNTNRSISEAVETVKNLQKISEESHKELIIYISMGFGNPYGENWNTDLVLDWCKKMRDLGIKTLSLSDTVGIATPDRIQEVFAKVIPEMKDVEIGAHLHTLPFHWFEKIDAAYQAGCRRFDGAIKGFGGCPMAKDDLVGNLPTEKLLTYLQKQQIPHDLNLLAFESAYNVALEVFG